MLAMTLAGRTVTAVETSDLNLRRPLDGETLRDRLIGRSFTTPRRRGKFLLCDLEVGGSLMIHLGMSGQVLIHAPDEPRPKHTHVILDLSDGEQLRFVDPRRFGFVHWLDPGEETSDASLQRLGPEPFGEAFVNAFPERVRQRKVAIKSLLLDQTLVAGVGNIYACEALWRAGIRPTRAGHRIARKRLIDLARAVEAVLNEAIEQGGTTLRDYRSPDGAPGYFAQRLDAYGREGETCSICGTRIERTVMGGRSTFWCPGHQR